MPILKASGMCIVMLSFTAFGFYKGYALKMRLERLNEIINGLLVLCEQIGFSGGELKELIPLCFSHTSGITFHENELAVSGEWLNADDKRIICEMLENLGENDAKTECDKIRRAVSVIEIRRNAALKDCDKKMKLWHCGGVCAGLAVCIFLI